MRSSSATPAFALPHSHKEIPIPNSSVNATPCAFLYPATLSLTPTPATSAQAGGSTSVLVLALALRLGLRPALALALDELLRSGMVMWTWACSAGLLAARNCVLSANSLMWRRSVFATTSLK